MLVLVTDTAAQGSARGDFCFSEEGSIVTAAGFSVCDSHTLSDPDVPSRCGCDRAFRDMKGLATTTTVVAERDVTRDELVETLYRRLFTSWNGGEDDPELREVAAGEVDEMLTAARTFGLGAVVRQNIRELFV